MMKITGLSHLFKWENLHNWWLTKYFFAPLYIHTHTLTGHFIVTQIANQPITWQQLNAFRYLDVVKTTC